MQNNDEKNKINLFTDKTIQNNSFLNNNNSNKPASQIPSV